MIQYDCLHGKCLTILLVSNVYFYLDIYPLDFGVDLAARSKQYIA